MSQHSESWEKDIEKMDSSRQDKQETKDIQRVALTNHVGKLKKKKNARKPMPPKPPRNYTKGTTFTNYGASLGMSDEQYKHWKKTGELPKKEGK